MNDEHDVQGNMHVESHTQVEHNGRVESVYAFPKGTFPITAHSEPDSYTPAEQPSFRGSVVNFFTCGNL